MNFDELKNYAISDILAVNGKDKAARIIKNHMDNLIEVALIKGAQSRQGEIDELQNKYDAMYRAFTVADDCRKEWHRCYVGIRQREDELQERIDEVLDYLGNCHRKIEIEKKHIENLLKGKENEH